MTSPNKKGRAKQEASGVVAPQKGDKLAGVYGVLSASLPYRAVRVGHVLIWHANKHTGRCDPSMARLARETGQSIRNVQRALKELEAATVIRKTRHAGGAYTNAYAVQWSGLRKRYENWLQDNGLAADNPDKTVTPPRTELSQAPDKTVHQTKEEQKKGIKEGGRSTSFSSLKRDDASLLGYQGEYGAEVVPPLSFLAKPKAPPSASVAREKAHQRLNDDLLNNLPGDVYAAFVGGLDAATEAKLIAAEVAKPGKQAGLRLALEVMNGMKGN